MRQLVVVFGATSFVGGEVIPALLSKGHQVVAVTRRPTLAKLVLEEAPELKVVTPGDVSSEVQDGAFDIVNLAYVKDAPTSKMYEANRRLVGEIGQVAGLGCRRLVHVSTAAVFGYSFSHAPVADRARWRPLGPYPESKIHAERLVEGLAKAAGIQGVILRLGNVLGPGAPTWTAGIGQRILEGKPVSYHGEAGFLNGTHVANIADYISYLMGDVDVADSGSASIHHLAELSIFRWPQLLDAMSEAMGRDWRAASRRQAAAGVQVRVKSALKTAYQGVPGSYARAAMAAVPSVGPLERLMDEVKSSAPAAAAGGPRQAAPEDEEILEIMASKYEFSSATHPGWIPPVDFATTCSQTAEWLCDSGYKLQFA